MYACCKLLIMCCEFDNKLRVGPIQLLMFEMCNVIYSQKFVLPKVNSFDF